MPESDRNQLRKLIRQARRDVPVEVNQAGSADVCQTIAASKVFSEARHIAVFIAADGELSLENLFAQAANSGKQLYVPVSLTDGSWRLEFHPWSPEQPLRKTPLGVLEPERSSALLPPDQLDLVLTPLVAFDKQCNRMGMGKGYYDRTFAFRNPATPEYTETPVLIGIAHACQQVENLQTDWWDVALDAVITPGKVFGNTSLLSAA